LTSEQFDDNNGITALTNRLWSLNSLHWIAVLCFSSKSSSRGYSSINPSGCASL